MAEYRDGGEGGALKILRSAHDLSSSSDELRLAVRDAPWSTQYHLLPERANVVRAFDFPSNWRVLEVGAGCGAVSRYLGEKFASIVSLEPELHRVEVAKERTRDLPNVNVVQGDLSTLAPEESFDLVIVVGVLEYVGEGTDKSNPYEAFLNDIYRRLRPGGYLLLCIENPLGVKYLAGAPEDHSGRIFDSVEGYPEPFVARTFSKRRLVEMIQSPGFEGPAVFGLFPDYKTTRCVLSSDSAKVAPQFTANLPSFPSDDHREGLKRRGPDERALWQTLVSAGLAEEFPNSFAVTARRPGGASCPVWPKDWIARYFSVGRAAAYSTVCTASVDRSGAQIVARDLLEPDTAAPTPFVELKPTTDSLVVGELLTNLIVTGEGDRIVRLLVRWKQAVELIERVETVPGFAHWDAVPRNVVVSEDDSIHLIDDEWRFLGCTAQDVICRGLLLTALEVAGNAPASRWVTERTPWDIAVGLGGAIGLSDDGLWLDAAAELEGRFQAEILPLPGSEKLQTAESISAFLRSQLNRPIEELCGGSVRLLRDPFDHEEALRNYVSIAASARVLQYDAQRLKDALQAVTKERDELASYVATL